MHIRSRSQLQASLFVTLLASAACGGSSTNGSTTGAPSSGNTTAAATTAGASTGTATAATSSSGVTGATTSAGTTASNGPSSTSAVAASTGSTTGTTTSATETSTAAASTGGSTTAVGTTGTSAGATSGATSGGATTGAVGTTAGATTTAGSSTGGATSTTSTSGSGSTTSSSTSGAVSTGGSGSNGTTSGSGGATCAAGHFSLASPVFFDGGAEPYDLLPVDVNGDGITDLVVVNESYPGGISVFWGIGDGGFATPTPFSVGNEPDFAIAGDFNRDGHLDLIVANSSSNNFSVLFGTGRSGYGAFLPQVTFPTDQYPYKISTGDYNGDGLEDLAVLCGGPGDDQETLGIFLGDGGGGFTAQPLVQNLGEPGTVLTGDFTGNGNDLAMPIYGGGEVLVLLNNGAQGFGTPTGYPTDYQPTGLAIGDFNNDGIQDFAVPSGYNGNIDLLYGTGFGSFEPAVVVANLSSPQSVASGDFNHDGTTDLVIPTTTFDNFGGETQMLALFMGLGDGGFIDAGFVLSTAQVGIATADFNGDGLTDVVVSDDVAGAVGILFGQCQ